jgi:hypothetical protein
MAKTTFQGTLRSGPKSASAGTVLLTLKASFDPTSATQIKLFTLPAGAIPLGVQSLGGATGGTNPTVDIGTVADQDGFAAELDADTLTLAGGSGALTGVVLTVDTPVYGQVGASAATGGTTTVIMQYVMNDDGAQG